MSAINSIDTHELVSSKENIQPLRRGRDTSILCAALQAENDTDLQQELEKQRNEFEIKLRSNTSDDPLSDWCSYIHWIEQSFPRQGREGKLNVVLRKCINKFKDCEKYMNDVRFVKLCIKYAEIEENTVELLSQMHRHGIGASCAQLYVTWAEKYAVGNCFKKANAIYERGLQCSAEPIKLLEEAYQNFQAFLVRKMLNDGETFQPTVLDSNPMETRQPYNVLQSVTAGQKKVVPNVRVGQNVIGAAGKLQQINIKETKSKSNKMIKVYEDNDNSNLLAEPKAKIDKLQSKKTMTKENCIKPGPWTNKQNKNLPFAVESSTPVPFQVHRDEDDEKTDNNDKKPRTVPSSVLKSHKVKTDYEDENFATAPLFYPEPYDPTRLSMYCKEQVYAGGLEFQFEELRAIQYRRKREEFLLKHSNAQKPAVVLATPEGVSGEVRTPSTLKADSHFEIKKMDGTADKRKGVESRRRGLFTNPVPVSEPPANNYVPEENLPGTDYSMNQTIHTKEALSEMQQLWFSKPPSPVPLIKKPAKPAAKSILKPSKPCFSLYVDESCLDNLKALEQPEKPLDLSIKLGGKDELLPESGTLNPPSGVRKKTGLSAKILPENCKENLVVLENLESEKKTISELEVDDENKENGVPEGYCGPIGKPSRKVSGILTPAENVEIAPLSDEEVEEDEEEGEEQNYSSIIQCNATEITETWNFTKGFQFPRGESTPNIRKSMRSKEECNESVYVSQQNEIKNGKGETDDNQDKLKDVNDKTVVLQSGSNKPASTEGENFIKNLSVIAESSREYRSSSSGSSGVSTLPLRYSKNFPYTPSETKSSKLSLTSSQTTLQKTKGLSYMGYEASSEFSQTAPKTPTAKTERVILNITYDLMTKLNAIESCSISASEKGDGAEVVNEGISKLEINDEELEKKESFDPFSEELIARFLEKVDFPNGNHSNGYFLLHDVELALPKVGSSISLGAHNFEVKKILGEGSYARIFKLLNLKSGESMIGKFQKPAFPWEFYISREVRSRMRDNTLAMHFMDVESAYFFKNSSILLTRPVEFGDLLGVINKMKQAKMMCQSLAMYFTCQILRTLETLHSCKIIHGDVKPDNFLLRNHNNKLQLQLIDFGRSIDMSLFPEGTTFRRVVTTEGFTTIEMKLNKPWTYQIDFYGIANCGHCLLFGDYMKVVEKEGVWNITKVIPRYWARTEWKNFFVSLINVESCSKFPSLSELRESFESVLEDNSEFEFSLFKLQNLLNDR